MDQDVINQRNNYERVFQQMEAEKTTFRTHWRDLSDYILPRRSRFFITDVNQGDRRNLKILDSTGTTSARTLRAGMMGGITSPARPWFKLGHPDPLMLKVPAAKSWLQDSTMRMRNVFLKSNLYNVLPTCYEDVGTFATSAIYMEEAFDGKIMQFYSFPIGSYGS